MSVILDPVQRLESDIKKAAATLGRDEARFLVEFYWAIGLIEGEGYFSPNPRSIVVSSTDQDVVERLKNVLGGYINGPYWNGPRSRKHIYRWQLSGWNRMEPVIIQMLPELSKRRKTQAQYLLDNPPNLGGRHPRITCQRGHNNWREYKNPNGKIDRYCKTCKLERQQAARTGGSINDYYS